MFGISDDFPPRSHNHWRDLVERDLKGASFEKKLVFRTSEGITIQPLYVRTDAHRGTADSLPGSAPHVRGARSLDAMGERWRVCQLYAHPNPAQVALEVTDDVRGGADVVELRIHDPTVPTHHAPGQQGVVLSSLEDLERIFEGIDPSAVTLGLDAGTRFLPAAMLVAAFWKRKSLGSLRARAFFHADPLEVFTQGVELDLGASMGQLIQLAKWTANEIPNARSIRVSSRPYSNAGASGAQELAFSLASGLVYLRELTKAGMSAKEAARQLVFCLDLDCDFFRSIAKMRAARRLWSFILERSGVEASEAGMQLHVTTAQRVLTERDPWVNMLRATTTAFAGAVGGAEVIRVEPFDCLLGATDPSARRIARNTQLILSEESHLGFVADPAGGSWFIEAYSEEMAESAWKILRDVERQGGMIEALRKGTVAARIASVREERNKDIAKRKLPITGVSEFPNLTEQLPAREHPGNPTRRDDPSRAVNQETALSTSGDLVDAFSQGATLDRVAEALPSGTQKERIAALPSNRFAEPFEALRTASDTQFTQSGRRPSAFLANLGTPAQHIARATFAKNLLEAGGIQAIDCGGFSSTESVVEAYRNTHTKVVVICGTDEQYQTLAGPTATALKAAGASHVVLAGRPADQEAMYRAGGVDEFIFIGCDVLASLTRLHQTLEIKS